MEMKRTSYTLEFYGIEWSSVSHDDAPVMRTQPTVEPFIETLAVSTDQRTTH